MIISVAHTSDTTVAITIDDGSIWYVDPALPPDTALRRQLSEWLAAGGVIAPYVAPPTPVPTEVTARQIRLALLQLGLLDAAEGWIATADRAISIEWQYATKVRRDNPMWPAAALALGKSEDDLDNLFRLAETK